MTKACSFIIAKTKKKGGEKNDFLSEAGEMLSHALSASLLNY